MVFAIRSRNDLYREASEGFPRGGGGGVLEVYMTGGSDVFFGVENLHDRYFFGSRDLSCIFFRSYRSMRIFLSLIFKRTFCFSFC